MQTILKNKINDLNDRSLISSYFDNRLVIFLVKKKKKEIIGSSSSVVRSSAFMCFRSLYTKHQTKEKSSLALRNSDSQFYYFWTFYRPNNYMIYKENNQQVNH